MSGRDRQGTSTSRAFDAVVDLGSNLILLGLIGYFAVVLVGSTPYLLDRIVPDRFRESVASTGTTIPYLSDWRAGASTHPEDVATVEVPGTAAPAPAPGTTSAPTLHAAQPWAPRRPGDVPPPDGLVDGEDYGVHTTVDGNLVHWPCETPIPVRTFGAPPGSTGDLEWAVGSLAAASGLPLRFAGAGAPDQANTDGAISVHYGDHPSFAARDRTAGIGGTRHYADGRIIRGEVTLRPGKLDFDGEDPATRAVILHELTHAVGLVHAREGRPEVMTPTVALPPRTDFGPGDRFALTLVGCR